MIIITAMQRNVRTLAVVAAIGAALGVSACSSGAEAGSAGGSGHQIVAVGAENEYTSVIQQVGGRYVQASAIMSNPNTDPHTFEASASVAREISGAQLVVQNGVGYDTFMDSIEKAVPDSSRKLVTVQKLLGLPDSSPNPHLWYQPSTMPAVANAVASDLAFVSSLGAWNQAVAAFRKTYPGTPVAVTEPVADYLLQAAGVDIKTPFAFQADVMNGTDPSAQDVALERSLFTQHKVKVFLYNQQVTDTLTQSFIALARSNGIPVVGVYETMPMPGYTYQSWMLAETKALQQAVASKKSTEKL
jgi:zinc/manganese transport system substrate-binding protein